MIAESSSVGIRVHDSASVLTSTSTPPDLYVLLTLWFSSEQAPFDEARPRHMRSFSFLDNCFSGAAHKRNERRGQTVWERGRVYRETLRTTSRAIDCTQVLVCLLRSLQQLF